MSRLKLSRLSALLLMLAAVLISSCSPTSPSTTSTDSSDSSGAVAVPTTAYREVQLPQAVLPDDTRIDLELAITDDEKARGLMFRPSLPESRGMLFVYEHSGDIGIWMKNTWISLDLIFLDETGTIIGITENAPPCHAEPCPTYDPGRMSRAVLEVAAGTVARHNLSQGTTLVFEDVPGYPAPPTEVDPSEQ